MGYHGWGKYYLTKLLYVHISAYKSLASILRLVKPKHMMFAFQILPLNIRGSAGSLATFTNLFISLIVSYVFNILLEWSPSGSLALCTITCNKLCFLLKSLVSYANNNYFRNVLHTCEFQRSGFSVRREDGPRNKRKNVRRDWSINTHLVLLLFFINIKATMLLVYLFLLLLKQSTQ